MEVVVTYLVLPTGCAAICEKSFDPTNFLCMYFEYAFKYLQAVKMWGGPIQARNA